MALEELIPEPVLTGMDAFSDFTNKLIGAAGAVCDMFSTILALFGDALKKALAIAEALIAAIVGIIGALIAAAMAFINSIVDFINGIIGEIFGIISAVLDDLKKLLAEIVLSISAGSCAVVVKLSIGVPAGIVAGFDAVNNFVNGNPLAELTAGVENYASKILDQVNGIADIATDSVNQLKGAIGSLGISL